VEYPFNPASDWTTESGSQEFSYSGMIKEMELRKSKTQLLPKQSGAKMICVLNTSGAINDMLDSDFKKALVCILTSQWCFMIIYCMDVKYFFH